MIKENQKAINKLNILLDIVLVFVSVIIAYCIRFLIVDMDINTEFLKLIEYLKFSLFMAPLQIIVYLIADVYTSSRVKNFTRESITVVNCNTVCLFIVLAVLYIFKIIHLSRGLFVIYYIVYTTLILLKKFLTRKALNSVRSRAFNLKNVIIVGSGDIAKDFLETIKSKKEYGYHYVGYVSDEVEMDGMYLGKYSDLYEVLQENKVDEVVCALDIEDSAKLEKVVLSCEKSGTKISIIPFYYKFIPSQPYIDQIDNIPLVNIRKIPLDNIINMMLKRIVDIVGSLFLILLFSPVMLVTAIGIKATSKGKIIFKQDRVGLNKEIFKIYKFRSMRENSESDTAWSKDKDDRKTKFGSFIRKFSLDELPQFFNVLKGDMSLVGPRPEIPHFVKKFQDEIPLYMVKHQVKPGITGWAQVNGYRGDTSIAKRIEYDIYYIENWNLIFDIIILFSTIFKGFKNTEVISK